MYGVNSNLQSFVKKGDDYYNALHGGEWVDTWSMGEACLIFLYEKFNHFCKEWMWRGYSSLPTNSIFLIFLYNFAYNIGIIACLKLPLLKWIVPGQHLYEWQNIFCLISYYSM